jgi:hypothetical protein
MTIRIVGPTPEAPIEILLSVGQRHPIGFAPSLDSTEFRIQPQMLECGSPRYTTQSMGYPAEPGDQVLVWDELEQDWRSYSRLPFNDPNQVLWQGEAPGLTPTIPAGRDFVVVPATSKRWVQSLDSVPCDHFIPLPERNTRFSLRNYYTELKNFWDATNTSLFHLDVSTP